MLTRRSTRSLRSLRLVALVAGLGVPAVSRAGESDDARAKFEAAQSAYDLGDFERARRLYADAYELKPLPGFLFNIGQCHKKLGEWSKAGFFFRRYLARVPPGTDVSRLQQLIAEMDERTAESPKPAAGAGAKAATPNVAPSVATHAGVAPAAVAVPRSARPDDAPRATASAGAAAAVAPVASTAAAIAPTGGRLTSGFSAAPIVVVEHEAPLYQRWWVWAGAGAATAAAVAAGVAIGVAASRPGEDGRMPRYGKLDAR